MKITGNLLEIWERIILKVEANLLFAENLETGLARNYIINDYYLRESAFAAKILGTEFCRTKNKIYYQKASQLIEKCKEIVAKTTLQDGFNEPQWTPRGVRYRKGSIPATTLFLTSLRDATDLLGIPLIYDEKSIVTFLMNCYLGNGRFYHDKIDKHIRNHQNHIINTTSMAYNYFQSTSQQTKESCDLKEIIKPMEQAIFLSQRQDGFWPYVEPNKSQKFFFGISSYLPEPLIKIYNRSLQDKSIFFGDAIHNIITLYYFLKGKLWGNCEFSADDMKLINLGWNFINSHLIAENSSQIRFDFSWEPKPHSLRYCNFIDTSTYFYILSIMVPLQKIEVLTKEEANKIKNGIINHIYFNLLSDEKQCISAFEGDQEIIDKIMPRASESIYDKGYLLSTVILDELGYDTK